MTEVTEKNVPYEILIRLDEDGSIHGAHYQTRHVITIDGRVVKNEVNNPIAIDKEEIKGIIGRVTAQAFADLKEAKDKIVELESKLHGHDRAARAHEARRGLSDEELRERSIKALRPGQGH